MTGDTTPPREAHRPAGIRTVAAALALQWRAAPVGSSCLLVSTIAIGAMPPAIAWLGRSLLNALTQGRSHSGQAVALALVLMGAGALGTAMLYLTGYLATSMRQKLTLAVEQRLFARVSQLLGLRYFDDPAFYDRLQLAEQAAQEAPQAISAFAQEGLRAAVTMVSFLAALLVIWPPITVFLLVAAGPAVVAQAAQARKRAAVAKVVATTYRRRLFYRSLLTDVRAAKEIRLFGLGSLLHGRMVDALAQASGAELAVERRATVVQAGLALLAAAVGAAGVVIVVAGATRGRFTVGDVTFFLAAVGGLQSTFAGVVSQAGEAGRQLYLFSYYVEIVHAPDDLDDGQLRPAPLRQGIDLSDVWFRYGPTGPWVLRGVDLFIPAGSTVGVVGLNGAGKSTLVKLLCRFYDPQRGRICWDGVDLRMFSIAELRLRLGATFQDFMSYELTAAENIGMGTVADLGDQTKIRHAARLAEADDTLSALPKGYETLLSRTFVDERDLSRGVTLSGGQWQRVALARSLMRADAELLILDEPSSGLDALAEHRIHATLASHGAGRTQLLISHRLSALREADVIVVLCDGRIAERGTHDELMGRGGEYARLFSLQAHAYQDHRVQVAQPG